MGPLESAALELLKASPIALAMLILVRLFMTALEKRDDKLATMAAEWSKVVERNTSAMIEFKSQAAICSYKGGTDRPRGIDP